MMSDQRIADDIGMPNHGEAADYFNQLLLDLKKQLLGYDHAPITLIRLERGTQHILDLDKCRVPTLYCGFWKNASESPKIFHP
jgi:hypothetical protein